MLLEESCLCNLRKTVSFGRASCGGRYNDITLCRDFISIDVGFSATLSVHVVVSHQAVRGFGGTRNGTDKPHTTKTTSHE